MAKETKAKNEEIFEGGPTKNQVENWKQDYANIYQLNFDEQTFIYRTLNRVEYKEIMNGIEGDENQEQLSWKREEKICNKCVLFPKDYDHKDMAEGDAGVPTVMSDYIMSKSGFNADGGPKKL